MEFESKPVGARKSCRNHVGTLNDFVGLLLTAALQFSVSSERAAHPFISVQLQFFDGPSKE